jgi:hypothetical protein
MSLNKGNEGTLDIQSTNFRGGGAKFTVEKEGTTYVIRDRAGMRQPGGSTYPHIAIQNTLDGLTGSRTTIEKVHIIGTVTELGAPIKVSSNTHLKWNGSIHLADGVNDNMIENANPGTYDVNVILEGGYLWGNKGEQSAGHGIYWKHASDPTEDIPTLWVRHVKMRNMDDDGLHLDFGSSPSSIADILGFGSRFPDGYGIYATDVDSFSMDWCHPIGGSNYSIGLNDCTNTFISNSYLGAGLEIVGCVRGGYSSIWIDNSTKHGVDLQGVSHQSFSGGQVRIFGSDVTDKDAIRMASDGGTHCTDNLFSNLEVGRCGGAASSTWRYGIEETDSNQDYNTYNMINGRDCTSGAVRLLGSNSVNGAEILGSVITS